MWLLENEGDIFGGNKLWLRPGKRYLFGRTSSEAGSFAIPEKTVSRKHLTIQVAEVPEGKGTDPRSRSTVTIEDLKTKLGTWVNGKNIKGEQLVLTKDENEMKVANYNKVFRITWHPVVLGFSFTKAELQQTDPWTVIRQNLEHLDIKYTAEYDQVHTTHVVSKKLGNTSKVLQALINGKFLVNDGFVQAIVSAAAPYTDDNGVETSALEKDFEGNWPKAILYLPPKADGPGANRPNAAFAPDGRRQEIFDGYTFIFYEKKRFDDLSPVISSGKGKALLKEAIPEETDIDDFVRYVKSIAGEKGLGEFEDGSEGRGVVVVRWVPASGGDNNDWFMNFYNQVALRLDHRPIETRDFLPAILDIEPAQLRRPLEIEPTPREPASQEPRSRANSLGNEMAMNVDGIQERTVIEESPPPPPRRGRQRPAPKSRFRGFDLDSDDEEEKPASVPQPASQGLFLTQQDDGSSQARQPSGIGRTQRKRPAPERDIMDEVAPTAAAIKRMRLEGSDDPLRIVEPSPPPVEQNEVPTSPPQKSKVKGRTAIKKGTGKNKKDAQGSDDEFLNQYLQEGQEEDANARAERELLQRQLAEGNIDFEDIRQGTTVETVEIRIPGNERGSRRQEDQEGRWNPKWNGLKNFKKFRKEGRAQPKTIIPLEPVKTKEYGIGDNYWLETKGKKAKNTQSQTTTQPQSRSQADGNPATQRGQSSIAIGSDSEDDIIGNAANNFDNSSFPDIMDMDSAIPSRSRKGKAAEKASQTARGSTTTQKRAAAEPPAAEKPAKRRATRATHSRKVDSSDGDDDEDSEDGGLNFRFGKRK